MLRLWCQLNRLLVGASVLVASAGCTGAHTQNIAVLHSAPARHDSAAFTAVVRSLRELHREDLRIDPRPLHDRTESLRPDYVELAGADAEARARVLGSMEIARTDAIRDAGCGGMIPPGVSHTPPAECPREGTFYSVAIGQIAATDSLPRMADSSSLAPRAGARYWAVPVTIRHMTAAGSTSTKFQYWLECASGCHEWRVVHREALHFTD
jgi:hypothetical protein